MKFLLFLSVWSISVAVITAAVGRGIYKDPEHPGKCVIDDVILSPGEVSVQNSPCARFSCGNDSFVEIHTCGALGTPPGYELGDPVMPEAPYPQCCPRELVRV